ncbi:Uncharacterized protein, contains FMN-binding domain [Paenibacillus sp. 1_12]|uniref:FMN-binding protein n=1 Tax=Paenibacillus sp. 1_12 TaxID=1566278 RepID=UPI0008EB3FE6|nr:FMN-binding protein [Paenibacillus sp. 1_12]SFL53718.1 Uncharacterized protein, contains FMN-binding domain [Paenibacillus sp. 1_12]
MAVIGKKLIALCSTAIGIVYAAGYFVTEPQSLQAMTPTEALMSPTVSSGEQTRPIGRQERHSRSKSSMPEAAQPSRSEPAQAESAGKPAQPPTGSAKPSTAQPKYKDGSYNGSGTNRFGTVEVAVTIKQGSIANVEITRSATRYPVTYIESLPQQVVEKQSANIDTVSRATNSSKDFIEAVLQALSKAQQLS